MSRVLARTEARDRLSALVALPGARASVPASRDKRGDEAPHGDNGSPTPEA